MIPWENKKMSRCPFLVIVSRRGLARNASNCTNSHPVYHGLSHGNYIEPQPMFIFALKIGYRTMLGFRVP